MCDSPALTGSGFEPSRTERYGEAYAVPRQFPAHNQYIDYAVRGGLPALAMLIIIMAWVARTLWRRLFSEAHPYIVAIGAVLLAAAVGGMTQLFMVQAMTGSLVWLMIALAREPYR